MEYFKKLLRNTKTLITSSKKKLLSSQNKQQFPQCSHSCEKYFYKAQHIIRWEKPSESLFYVLLVNIFFWFLTYIQWKFYGLVFAIISSLVIYEAWTQFIWPEIKLSNEMQQPEERITPHEGDVSFAEVSRYAANFKDAIYRHFLRLRRLRSTEPPVYCAVVSVWCVIMAAIGNLLSGISLFYLLVMSVMILPGVFKHFLSPDNKLKLQNTLHFLYCILIPPAASRNIDEYMPESTKENLTFLTQAGENNDLSTPSTEDSSLGDLLIPAYDESSVDTVESLMLPTIPQDSSEDTDSDVGALRFKSTHFNGGDGGGGGSSTDEDISLVKDLVFPDITDVGEQPPAPPSTTTSSLLSNTLRQSVTEVLYKTLSGAAGLSIQGGPSTDLALQKESLDNSDDSEFEIIYTEDAN